MTLDELSKLAQICFWLVGAAAAVFGVWKHFDESKEKRQWEKAKFAKEIVDGLDKNEKAIAATYMLGAWESRVYVIGSGNQKRSFSVSQREAKRALTAQDAKLTDKQRFVRECFDNFLFHLEQFVLAEQQRLVEWSQLRPLLITFFAGIRRELKAPLIEYARSLRYFRASTVLDELIELALTKPSSKDLTVRSSGHDEGAAPLG